MISKLNSPSLTPAATLEKGQQPVPSTLLQNPIDSFEEGIQAPPTALETSSEASSPAHSPSPTSFLHRGSRVQQKERPKAETGEIQKNSVLQQFTALGSDMEKELERLRQERPEGWEATTEKVIKEHTALKEVFLQVQEGKLPPENAFIEFRKKLSPPPPFPSDFKADLQADLRKDKLKTLKEEQERPEKEYQAEKRLITEEHQDSIRTNNHRRQQADKTIAHDIAQTQLKEQGSKVGNLLNSLNRRVEQQTMSSQEKSKFSEKINEYKNQLKQYNDLDFSFNGKENTSEAFRKRFDAQLSRLQELESAIRQESYQLSRAKTPSPSEPRPKEKAPPSPSQARTQASRSPSEEASREGSRKISIPSSSSEREPAREERVASPQRQQAPLPDRPYPGLREMDSSVESTGPSLAEELGSLNPPPPQGRAVNPSDDFPAREIPIPLTPLEMHELELAQEESISPSSHNSLASQLQMAEEPEEAFPAAPPNEEALPRPKPTETPATLATAIKRARSQANLGEVGQLSSSKKMRTNPKPITGQARGAVQSGLQQTGAREGPASLKFQQSTPVKGKGSVQQESFEGVAAPARTINPEIAQARANLVKRFEQLHPADKAQWIQNVHELGSDSLLQEYTGRLTTHDNTYFRERGIVLPTATEGERTSPPPSSHRPTWTDREAGLPPDLRDRIAQVRHSSESPQTIDTRIETLIRGHQATQMGKFDQLHPEDKLKWIKNAQAMGDRASFQNYTQQLTDHDKGYFKENGISLDNRFSQRLSRSASGYPKAEGAQLDWADREARLPSHLREQIGRLRSKDGLSMLEENTDPHMAAESMVQSIVEEHEAQINKSINESMQKEMDTFLKRE